MEILRQHLLEGVSVSEVWDEYELNPNLYLSVATQEGLKKATYRQLK